MGLNTFCNKDEQALHIITTSRSSNTIAIWGILWFLEVVWGMSYGLSDRDTYILHTDTVLSSTKDFPLPYITWVLDYCK